ncbi:MAG TPA: 5'-3'-deoxyribonucleotidase [Candidatus Paceibacterota bacterium]
MIILVDQDGPLANFEQGFLDGWRFQFSDELFIPLEERKTFYLRDQYQKHLREKVESIYFAPGFYKNLPPVDGAIEAIKELVALGYEVMICTSPLGRYENCILEKYQWIEKYLGEDFTKKIILTKDKTLIRGDILIDDKPGVTGIFEPSWEHVIFDYPFNRPIIGKRRINWGNCKEILNL